MLRVQSSECSVFIVPSRTVPDLNFFLKSAYIKYANLQIHIPVSTIPHFLKDVGIFSYKLSYLLDLFVRIVVLPIRCEW